jgi:hypothetical protein
MHFRGETVKMGVPPGNRPAVPRDWFRGVPERYVAGCDTRGRPEGRLYPRSQQVIHETSGLSKDCPLSSHAGTLEARELLGQYCTLIYQRYGTYQEVARRTGLDRRTVKKYVQENIR